MEFTRKLDLHNVMVLISENGPETELESQNSNIPCRKVKASTPWKRQRDQILFDYIKSKISNCNYALKLKPILIFVNSRTEVNLVASSLRTEFPDLEESLVKAIAIPLTLVDFFSELKALQGTFSILILSAESSMAAFVHGMLKVDQFSAFIFVDTRGANQNHPFCTLMNYFYAPLRASPSGSFKPRILGFTDLKSASEIEENMFTRREWIKALKHITHTFHCVPLTIDQTDQDQLIYPFLDEIPADSPIFDPLAIYETRSSDFDILVNAKEFTTLDNIDSLSGCCDDDCIVLRHETRIEEIPQLLEFIKTAKLSGTKHFIHIHSPSPQFSAQLSLHSCLKNLDQASGASAKSLDPTLANSLCRDATSLFSQSEHLIKFTSKLERALRVEETGALLVECTAVPILVRCCTLLARKYRQSAANERIHLKSIKAFPVDETGKKKSTFFSHLALLRLPQFFYERIRHLEGFSPLAATIESDDNFHLQGPLLTSIHQSQCCVAFEACKLLFAAGILDEHLLLAEEFRKPPGDEDGEPEDLEDCCSNLANPGDPLQLLEECCDDAGTVLSFNELIPRGLLQPERPAFPVYVYALEYELKMQSSPEDPFGNDFEALQLTPLSRLLLQSIPSVDFFSVARSIRTWSVVLPERLPGAFVPVEIPLGSDHYLKTDLKLIQALSSDSPEYSRLLSSQQAFFGMFNMKPITVPDFKDDEASVFASNPNGTFDDHVPKDKNPFYLIAPLIEETYADVDDPELVEIASIPKVKELYNSFVERFRLAPLSGIHYKPPEPEQPPPKQKNWVIDWKLCERVLLAEAKPPCLLDYMRVLEEEAARVEGGEPMILLEEGGEPMILLEEGGEPMILLEEGGEPVILLEEGGVPVDFKRFALGRLAFLTPHTKIFYRLNRPLPRGPVYPTDAFDSPAYPQASTHADYVAARYNLHIRHLGRSMLEVKRIENWNDLAIWISADGATKKRRKNKSIKKTQASASSASLIIPEITQIFPASYSTFRLSMLLPRVSFEIERQLRIAQFFTDCLPAALAPPSHCRQVEALTASTAALSYSYEQLEVLGDSFLKYYSSLDTLLVGAGWSEGRLSSHRQQSLCNATLRRAAQKLNLATYASFTPFFSRLWCPPALTVPAFTPLENRVNHVLFGPAERWRLLALVEGKQANRQVMHLLDPHNRITIDQGYRTKEQARNSTDALYKYGQLIPPKALADIIEALIAVYYIDGGPRSALQFLHYCGILKADEIEIDQLKSIDPITCIVGSNAWQTLQNEQHAKLKRRKSTAITEIVLNNSNGIGAASSAFEESPADLVRKAMSIDTPVAPKIDNVRPFAPPFDAFPFDSCESLLGHRFRRRELLFIACTHVSLHPNLNHEKLEWIGDAAIDWIVCRNYWYNYRITSSSSSESSELSELSQKPPSNQPSHHLPVGYLSLTPEALTNSRQSAINNEAFARLIVRHGLHRFLRINSPHLQLEIGRFAKEESDREHPEALKDLHTHVNMAAPKVLGDLFEALMGAVLLDSAFDIEAFAQTLDPFLRQICSDPQSLPINAIQETLHMYARLGIPRHQIVCTYREINTSTTADNALGVICQIWVRERCVAEAEGSNKLVAKKLAMERALQDLLTRQDH